MKNRGGEEIENKGFNGKIRGFRGFLVKNQGFEGFMGFTGVGGGGRGPGMVRIGVLMGF